MISHCHIGITLERIIEIINKSNCRKELYQISTLHCHYFIPKFIMLSWKLLGMNYQILVLKESKTYCSKQNFN